MSVYPFRLDAEETPSIGLVVLQTDERLERDFRTLIPAEVPLFVSRVPSAPDVSADTLQSMEQHLTGAAALLPGGHCAIGYGCTSGTAQIGAGRIAELIHASGQGGTVTEPVTALIAACHHLGLRRLTFLSPYVASVSDNLRRVLAENGIETPTFGSFDEAEEARVARIHPDSIVEAGYALSDGSSDDALFLSCTNLRGVEAGPALARRIGRPVLSSNLVLAWHLCRLAGVTPPELDHSAA